MYHKASLNLTVIFTRVAYFVTLPERGSSIFIILSFLLSSGIVVRILTVRRYNSHALSRLTLPDTNYRA